LLGYFFVGHKRPTGMHDEWKKKDHDSYWSTIGHDGKVKDQCYEAIMNLREYKVPKL